MPILNYDNISLIPNKTIVSSRSECLTSQKLGKHIFLLPVIPGNMKSVVNYETCRFLNELGLFYIMHRFGVDNLKFVESFKLNNALTSISVGVKHEDYRLIEELAKQHLLPDYITVDIANAYANSVENLVPFIRQYLPNSFLIVGNVATFEGTKFLDKLGVDAIKIGIAGGSVCTTRLKTGFSVPMLSCILDCREATSRPLIADGGIKHSADIVKALVAGADFVMAGNLFAGYEQSAGDVIIENGQRFKEYYGSASEFNKGENKHVEGTKILIPYKGDMTYLIQDLKESLQSAISYAGGTRLADLRKVEYNILK